MVTAGAPTGSTGSWIFNPVSNTHASITANISGEDYSALLMGEVSGNWGDPSPFRPALGGGPERRVAITAPHLVTPWNRQIIVPIGVQGTTNKGIIAYEFDLRFDPLVMQPQAIPVDVAGTVSRGLTAVANAQEPGLLRVAVYGVMPIDGNGVLLNLRFTPIGATGSVSPITWERILLNEGSPRVQVTDGQVELSTAVIDPVTAD